MLQAPTAIPAFSDNYIWAIHDGAHCVVVDPGDPAPVEAWLAREGLTLSALLITHHHPDHVGGVSALCRDRDIPVYGPARETIPEMDHPLRDGDRVRLATPDLELEVIDVPGHTLGHIAFHAPEQGWLFCGDTLFAGGCGRLRSPNRPPRRRAARRDATRARQRSHSARARHAPQAARRHRQARPAHAACGGLRPHNGAAGAAARPPGRPPSSFRAPAHLVTAGYPHPPPPPPALWRCPAAPTRPRTRVRP